MERQSGRKGLNVCLAEFCGFPEVVKINDDFILTVHHNFAVCAVIIDLLDVAKVDVAKKDAVGSLPSATMIVKAEGDDILHVIRVFKWLNWCIEVRLVRQVDALEDGTLRVEQVPVIVTAAAVVLCQHAMSTGAGALAVTTEKTQLLTAAVVDFADIGAWGECDTL